MFSFNLKSKGREDFHFGTEVTHQFCFMSSKFFFRSLDLVFFHEYKLGIIWNWDCACYCFFFFSSWVLNAYLFIYLFLPTFEQTSECETHQKATLKKKKKTEKPISVKMYEWKNVDFFFLRSGFVHPQSPKLTLFSFKNKWLKLDPLEIPFIVQERCVCVIPHTWWTKWTEQSS